LLILILVAGPVTTASSRPVLGGCGAGNGNQHEHNDNTTQIDHDCFPEIRRAPILA
jgi:hypothetical protein